MKRFADLDGPDFFPTPAWATYALIDNEKFAGGIWECACGDGAMSRVLDKTGCPVGQLRLAQSQICQIGFDLTAKRRDDNIITNPPYNSAEGFVAAGIQKANQKFALLSGSPFLRALTEPTPSSRAARQAAFGYSANASHFTLPVPYRRERGPLLTLGLSGTRTRADELKWLRPGYKARYS